jgi:hypothetical protein
MAINMFPMDHLLIDIVAFGVPEAMKTIFMSID